MECKEVCILGEVQLVMLGEMMSASCLRLFLVLCRECVSCCDQGERENSEQRIEERGGEYPM